MPRNRYRIHDSTKTYFLTCTVVGWLPLFSRRECAEIILNSWKFLGNAQRLTLNGYVILENHLHFIAWSPNIAKELQAFKSYTARQCIDFLITRGDHEMLGNLARRKQGDHSHSDYQVWIEGCHPIEIGNDDMMDQKLTYIHNNPVRRGYVDKPEDWRYSSMRNYLGLEGLITVETDWKYRSR